MATITMHWQGDGIAQLIGATDALVGSRRHAAFRRALNHTGDKTHTQVRRTLTKQMGLTSQALFKQGRALSITRASDANLVYTIKSSGRAVRAKEFKHRITGSGITFAPWGKSRHVKSAFVINRYSGNFYRRRTAKRFPLEALYGPNLNKEIVKDATAAAFHVTAAQLPQRIGHEIRVITAGIVS